MPGSMPGPTLIVSDIHLGAPASQGAAFLEFLRGWTGEVDLVLINGDLFDFWFEYRTVIPSQHFEVLRVLAELRESGVDLMLIGGNHDSWGGRFLEREIGMRLADGPLEMELAGRKAFVAHGDGLGPGDLGYKILKRTLRTRPVQGLMRMVHPDLADRIVRRISRTGGQAPADIERTEERARVLEEVALEVLGKREDIDLVIFGHCHMPQVKPVDGDRYYINSGDWIAHRTYTLLTEDEIFQKEWVGGDQGSVGR